MNRADTYRAVADLVLMTHLGFVMFIVMGLLVILVGGYSGWNWIQNPWFRWLHLAGIALVISQSWMGIVCPLTTLEMALRDRAGDLTYRGTFIAHWLQLVLYYEAPQWVFGLVYGVFGSMVVVGWFKFRPRPFWNQTTIATVPAAGLGSKRLAEKPDSR
jgi:hypothetical protein